MGRWKKIIIKEPTVVSGQKSIFDVEMDADDRATEGMESSYKHSTTEYKRAASERLTWLIQNADEFTSDDIVNHLNKIGIVGNHASLGAMIKGAERAGLISATGKFIESCRPECHKRPIRIWKSNVIKEAK